MQMVIRSKSMRLMSVVDYNDAIENYTGDDEYGIPTAEGLANGKKAYVISGNDYLQDSGKVNVI